MHTDDQSLTLKHSSKYPLFIQYMMYTYQSAMISLGTEISDRANKSFKHMLAHKSHVVNVTLDQMRETLLSLHYKDSEMKVPFSSGTLKKMCEEYQSSNEKDRESTILFLGMEVTLEKYQNNQTGYYGAEYRLDHLKYENDGKFTMFKKHPMTMVQLQKEYGRMLKWNACRVVLCKLALSLLSVTAVAYKPLKTLLVSLIHLYNMMRDMLLYAVASTVKEFVSHSVKDHSTEHALLLKQQCDNRELEMSMLLNVGRDTLDDGSGLYENKSSDGMEEVSLEVDRFDEIPGDESVSVQWQSRITTQLVSYGRGYLPSDYIKELCDDKNKFLSKVSQWFEDAKYVVSSISDNLSQSSMFTEKTKNLPNDEIQADVLDSGCHHKGSNVRTGKK